METISLFTLALVASASLHALTQVDAPGAGPAALSLEAPAARSGRQLEPDPAAPKCLLTEAGVGYPSRTEGTGHAAWRTAPFAGRRSTKLVGHPGASSMPMVPWCASTHSLQK